jgi:diacylglycerol kinase (ATP)
MNKPKFNLFNNTIYALKGFRDILQTERSFQIESVALFVIVLPLLLFVELPLLHKLIFFVSSMLVLLAEILNSAIERVVDLVTLEHHDLAGRAKDVGSAAVLLTIIVWGIVFVALFGEKILKTVS